MNFELSNELWKVNWSTRNCLKFLIVRRFLINQKFWFELSSDEWKRIFRNFQKRRKGCEVYRNFWKFLSRNFLSIWLSRMFEWFAFRKSNHFHILWKLCQEFALPYVTFSWSLVEWTAPMVFICDNSIKHKARVKRRTSHEPNPDSTRGTYQSSSVFDPIHRKPKKMTTGTFTYNALCMKTVNERIKTQQEIVKKNCHVVSIGTTAVKDVRAHCYCASLVRTLFIGHARATSFLSARTESKT